MSESVPRPMSQTSRDTRQTLAHLLDAHLRTASFPPGHTPPWTAPAPPRRFSRTQTMFQYGCATLFLGFVGLIITIPLLAGIEAKKKQKARRTPISSAAFVPQQKDSKPPQWKPDFEEHPENRWVKLSPSEGRPVPRFGWEGSGDLDRRRGRWIHHGGHDGNPQGFILFDFDLKTGTWTQRFPPTSPPGVCCVDGANVFDQARGRFLAFPGASLGHGFQWSRGVKLKQSHVWAYDPDANEWINMRPPPYSEFQPREQLGRLNATATYDPTHELAWRFGGQTSSGGTSGLFAYDLQANALWRLDGKDGPSARDGAGLCYDAGNDCLVLFGSQYASDEKTWLFRCSTGKWEAHDLKPRPPGKKGKTYSTIPRLAYDSRNGVCLCLTWDDATGQHETWVLDVARLRWTKLEPTASPEPSMSRSRNLSYSPEHNLFFLETSVRIRGGGTEPQLWTFRYKKAPADSRPQPPSAVEAVADSDRVTLRWNPPSPRIRKFAVYRGTGERPWQVKFEKLATVEGKEWVDRGIKPGVEYRYLVRSLSDSDVEGPSSFQARTRPPVLLPPVVSVLGARKVEIRWQGLPGKDIAGYEVYRGLVNVRSVKQGTPGAWKDNDPEYDSPLPVEVRNITAIEKLTPKPISETSFTDTTLDLRKEKPGENEYRFQVYAYIVRAVNRQGVSSGPSPYALTIPSEPRNLLNREKEGTAELKWSANPEKGIAGYHVYKLEGTWKIVRVTDRPIRETTFKHAGGRGTTRYWVTAVDALGQEGQPSSPAWHNKSYRGFFEGEWHQ